MFASERIRAMIEPVTSQLTAYRDKSITSSGEVSNKLMRFVDCYHDDIECFDANANKIIFPNKEVFQERYKTVFRESPDLDAIVSKRFLLFQTNSFDVHSQMTYGTWLFSTPALALCCMFSCRIPGRVAWIRRI